MKRSGVLGVALNAALVAATAQLLAATLHETGHGLVAQTLGFSPKIYAFYENNPSGTKLQDVLILSGGPLASLIVGLLFFVAFYRLRKRDGFGGHLLLWLAILCVMAFVNYLIVTPWLAAGDTARLADIFGLGTAARYGVMLAGVAMLFLLARPAARAMLAASPPDVPLESAFQRKRYVRTYFYFPLLFSLPFIALAGIGGHPQTVGYGLLGSLGNIDIVAVALGTAGSLAAGANPSERRAASLGVEPARIVLYVAVTLFYILALSRGVPV